MIRHRDHRFTARKNGAFTLVEVLVSSAILLVLILLLLVTGNGTSRLWSDSEGKREAARELRASLQMITEDLHSAVYTTNSENGSLEIHLSPRGDSLFFLVSHPHDRRQEGVRGDLCAAGYFLAPDPKGNGCTNLYRFHAAGETVAGAVEQGRVSELYAEASPQNLATTELMARNIVAMKIDALPERTTPPELLEITLTAINAATAHLVALDPKATARNERLLRQRGQTSTAIIHLPTSREKNLVP